MKEMNSDQLEIVTGGISSQRPGIRKDSMQNTSAIYPIALSTYRGASPKESFIDKISFCLAEKDEH